MKVLFVITRGDEIGGAQIHVLTLVKLLQRNGNSVLVAYGGDSSGPFSKLLTQADIDHISIRVLKREISLFKDLISIFKLKNIVSVYKPDIVTLHSSKAGFLGRISLLFTNIPVLYTVHGWAFTDGIAKNKAKFYNKLEKLLAYITNKIIVVSEYDKSLALKHHIMCSDKIEVVHNGIKTNDLHRDDTLKENLNLIMVARFDEQKDHESLILACKNIEKIKLHLLGGGPNLGRIEKLVHDLKIESKVVFYGYSNQVDSILKEADIFLLISNWEGFPISTLEAMNYSLPVIISDVGGSSEAVDNNKTGYLVEKKNINQITNKIKLLIENRELRLNMGILGKAKLLNNFTEEKMYQKTFKIYLDLIKSKS
ncbi:MAG: glycosyltransferase family 1 protein [Sphingobacteriales bacterium]|nr:MAG: glycosyltransferase family 1 protein [Sphingobacteriales bacterium]TAF83190.1 MAG: glycosyltransferase family 1 protein [Sphingobacteriales bacterium]